MCDFILADNIICKNDLYDFILDTNTLRGKLESQGRSTYFECTASSMTWFCNEEIIQSKNPVQIFVVNRFDKLSATIIISLSNNFNDKVFELACVKN